MRCGLLGGKLGHSYSPFIHSYLGDYSYTLFEKSPEELDDFLKYGDFTGLNVTIPYKKTVIPYCQELSQRAAQLGAVNTLVRRSDGTLIGHNTDYFGFSSMLAQTGLQIAGKKALILGSGGASATVSSVLKENGADVIVISRNGENNYNNLDRHKDAAILVNATPVGMYPDNGHSPVSLDAFPALEGVLDLIYNPARTALLIEAERRGLKTQNGLWMLVAQAWESAQWFTGDPIDESKIADIHNLLRCAMENIVLIGMPGCGKSTVGKRLSDKLGKTFIDADTKIVEAAGISIPEIFKCSGEEGFRKIETEVLRDLGAMSGIVLATGGGCVTRPENLPLLHQNGTIYYLQRDIDKLPTEGRPLSQANALSEMFRVRKPLYECFADRIIDNNQDVDFTVNTIIHQENHYENSCD